MRIYLTHCSAKKDDSLKKTGREVAPEALYKATPLQRFVSQCKKAKVQWAIFSDKFGVWFPVESHEWYEKDPDTVTEEEFKILKKSFEERLGRYDEIYFYYNPGRFHPLYKRLLREVKVMGRIVLFTHKDRITKT
jgi:hypothetical protein